MSYAHLRSLPAVPIARAPAIRASWPATDPTTPAAAETMLSPEAGSATSAVPKYAVAPGIPSTPSAVETDARSGSTHRASSPSTVAFAIHREAAPQLIDTQGQRGPAGYEATLTDATTDDPPTDREVVISSNGETLHTGQTAADGTLFVKRGTLFGDTPPEGDPFTLTATFDAGEERYVIERRENGPRMVLLSVAWFVCSLPLITIGPATFAAYAAVASLRETYAFDRGRILTVLKRHGVSAVLRSGVPLLLAAISVLYALEYFAARSTFLLVLSVGSAHAAAYATPVLVPTFVDTATGGELESSIRAGFRWTSVNAIGAVTLAMATLVAFLVTGLLTVAFVVVFAGLAAAFHVHVLLEPPEHEQAAEQHRTLYASTDGRRTD